MTPKLEIDALFFNATSILTGGIVDDLTTVLIALVGLILIFVGFDKLRDSLDAIAADRGVMKSRSEMQKQKLIFENKFIDSIDRDIARARYRAALRKIN